MSTLGAGQLYELARGAGFAHEQAVTMAAIALAESGGRTDAVGDVSLQTSVWGPSLGLWQVRSLNAQRGTGKERDALILTDPARNAASARIIYSQQGYRAWSVYSSGAYAKHIGAVRAAVVGTPAAGRPGIPTAVVPGNGLDIGTDALGGAVVGAAGGALSGLDAVGGFFASLGKRGTWVRVLQVLGGTGLVVGGLAILGKDVAGAAVKVAADVVPVGRAVKAAGTLAKAAS